MKTLKTIGFWLLSCTWGIIMTLIGSTVALVLLITKHRPHRFGPCIYFEVGYGWGGVELGPFFVVSKYSGESIKQHEAGHGIQNIVFGPLMPFLVCLPSALRYWVRNRKTADDRVVFVSALCLGVIILTGIPLIVLANVLVTCWPLFLAGAIIIYVSSLWLWQILQTRLFCKECGDRPYDSVWFEGWATKLGDRFW